MTLGGIKTLAVFQRSNFFHPFDTIRRRYGSLGSRKRFSQQSTNTLRHVSIGYAFSNLLLWWHCNDPLAYLVDSLCPPTNRLRFSFFDCLNTSLKQSLTAQGSPVANAILAYLLSETLYRAVATDWDWGLGMVHKESTQLYNTSQAGQVKKYWTFNLDFFLSFVIYLSWFSFDDSLPSKGYGDGASTNPIFPIVFRKDWKNPSSLSSGVR